MRAIVLHGKGGLDQLRWEEVPDPQLGPGQALVRIQAAALNHRDVWIRLGQYAKIVYPAILGSDGAGKVVQVGSAEDQSWVGREVVINPSLDWGPDPRAQGPQFRILGMPDSGTYAELIQVPVANLYRKPRGLSMKEAAALPLAGLTAYRALVTRGRLQKGETVLITGIGGGVATLALQMARALGAKVLVTSGSEEKLTRAKEWGASGAFLYRDADWTKQVLKASDGAGVDLVIDGAGGEGFNKLPEVVRTGGRIVNYGATAGPVPQFVLARVFWKQMDILGSTMGNGSEFAAMLELYDEAQMRPVLSHVFPLPEAAAAHQMMEQGSQLGKLVLTVD